MHKNTLLIAIRQARQAVAGIGHFSPGGDLKGITNRAAASMAHLDLRSVMAAPSTPDGQRAYPLSVTMRQAGEIQTIHSSVLQASRVIRAGATLIPIDDAPTPVPDSQGTGAWYSRASRFAVVTGATFGAVADGANATETERPVASAEINLAESASHAVRFRISRADQKAVNDEALQFEIEHSIVLGLASLADKVLLDAITASTPAAYSLAAAASSGARFAELKAIIGRNGNGGVVNAAGNLVAAGLPAELTDQTALTYAGIWSRSAIACEREIRVLIERRDLMGNLVVTVFANMQAVLPSPNTFWTVAA